MKKFSEKSKETFTTHLKMARAERIKEEFSKILKIIYHANESYKILHFLWTTSNDEVIDNIKSRELFFAYSKDIFYKDVMIEMSKLFHQSDNEQFNLQKFINKLENDSKYRGVISVLELNDWRSKLTGVGDAVKKIIALRTGYAAHTDRHFKTEDHPLSLKDIKEVIDVSYHIAKAIFKIIDGSEFLIERDPISDSPLISLKHILVDLADKRKETLRPMFRHAMEHGLESEIPVWFKDEQP